MKLDTKKTIKVGFAFAIIMLFWTAYDFVIPLLLENVFGLSNSMRGLIMGLDNLLSLFLLPVFGKLSDKTNTKYGKRTPYIFIGTIISVVLMIFVPISANGQLKKADAHRAEVSQTLTPTQFGEWYDLAESGKNTQYVDIAYLKNNNVSRADYIEYAVAGIKYYDVESKGIFGKTYYWGQSGEELAEYELTEYKDAKSNYTKYVSSGVNTYLSERVESDITKNNIGTIVIYMIILLFVLIAMATFRSPAVALMPDVTPKPLRSQGNAIINLAGGAGGAIAFLIYTIAFFINPAPYIGIFVSVGAGMLLLLACFMIFVKEPKFAAECKQICAEYGIEDEEEETAPALAAETTGEKPKKRGFMADKSPEEKAKFKSFVLILASIFMWFMGYNAISSNLSVYCVKVLNLDASIASVISGVSMGISAIAFIPVGMLAVKIGRRKSIMLGFALAVISFVLLWLPIVRAGRSAASILFAAFYLIAGFGLIIANVNTFPMVVELSTAENVGKYTGYYYTATMSAQAITPFIAGLVMDNINNYALFGYSAICVVVAIVLMVFVKHGDSKALPPKSKLEMLGAGDD